MAEQINLKAAGLYLDANPLSEAPQGAMSEASDVIISRPGVVETRPGTVRYYDVLPDFAKALTTFKGRIFGHQNSDRLFATATDNAIDGDFVDVADLAPPDGEAATRVRFQEASKNLYMTSSLGIRRSDDGTALAAAGAPRALDPTLAISSTSAGLWLTAAHQVAYYLTWSITDANGNTHEGAPSGRVVIDNTGATDATVDVTVPVISSEMTTAHVLKIYRTSIQASGIDPGAEAQLVYQRSPTSAEVTAGTLTFEDVVPDALRGATAYFAPSQEGILSGNDAPPLAKDLCLFRGTMFYANTTGKQRLQLSLLAVGGTDGLQANGTITINGVTYTAKASPSAATDFQITTSGTVSQNIEATARALVAAVNRYAAASAGTIGAYYLSGELDAPGKMLFEERGLGGSSFSATASAHAAAWSPQLPTSGTTVSSDADVKPNRLCWSKYQQPEAVPLLNFVDVGSGNAAILRILALRDSLIILKEDGAFRVTGDAGFFRVDLLDESATLVAPNSAAVLANRVYGLFSMGVLAVSDTGAESVSFGRVDSEIRGFQSAGWRETLAANAFGAACETSRQYILGGLVGELLVYDAFTDCWTIWQGQLQHALCATVGPDGYFAFGTSPSAPNYSIATQAFNAGDDGCTDYAAQTTVTSVVDGTTIVVSDAADIRTTRQLFQPTDTIGSGPRTNIVAINGTTITVEDSTDFAAGLVAVQFPVAATVKYLPATAGTASAKQFTEAALLFEATPPSAITAEFATDLGASASVTLEPGLSSNPGEMWTWVPPECQRCGRLTLKLTHQVAGERLRLLGVSLKARTYGERRFGR